ncbi:hypothetical protein [Pontibacter beigongshangensis]|uniref:hypothetical protein n=1 Tax=Pontibacter beigongshangensis TaxID=2574733 RepID=UPI00164F4650|nr:hypothetical protein [Pontibacter beigongshangensis]
MKNNKQPTQPTHLAETGKTKPATKEAKASTLPESSTTSQSSSSSGQTSGGAMPNIQGANQSREAEQNDLR